MVGALTEGARKGNSNNSRAFFAVSITDASCCSGTWPNGYLTLQSPSSYVSPIDQLVKSEGRGLFTTFFVYCKNALLKLRAEEEDLLVYVSWSHKRTQIHIKGCHDIDTSADM